MAAISRKTSLLLRWTAAGTYAFALLLASVVSPGPLATRAVRSLPGANAGAHVLMYAGMALLLCFAMKGARCRSDRIITAAGSQTVRTAQAQADAGLGRRHDAQAVLKAQHAQKITLMPLTCLALAFIISTTYGAALEWLQLFVESRQASFADIGYNAVGAAAGCIAWFALHWACGTRKGIASGLPWRDEHPTVLGEAEPVDGTGAVP